VNGARPPALLAFALAATLALPGCVELATITVAHGFGGLASASQGIEAPVWAAGDRWTYRVVSANASSALQAARVEVEAAGEPCPQEAPGSCYRVVLSLAGADGHFLRVGERAATRDTLRFLPDTAGALSSLLTLTPAAFVGRLGPACRRGEDRSTTVHNRTYEVVPFTCTGTEPGAAATLFEYAPEVRGILRVAQVGGGTLVPTFVLQEYRPAALAPPPATPLIVPDSGIDPAATVALRPDWRLNDTWVYTVLGGGFETRTVAALNVSCGTGRCHELRITTTGPENASNETTLLVEADTLQAVEGNATLPVWPFHHAPFPLEEGAMWTFPAAAGQDAYCQVGAPAPERLGDVTLAPVFPVLCLVPVEGRADLLTTIELYAPQVRGHVRLLMLSGETPIPYQTLVAYTRGE